MVFIDTDYPLVDSFKTHDPAMIWIVVVSFVSAFFLAFGVGANDVANSFGTSVGSGVLTLRQACVLATIFEVLGAISLGYNVSETIRTGMIKSEFFAGQNETLMLGFLAALIGSSIWNIVATIFGLPISGTHSIVGAIIGFAITSKGFNSVQWNGLLMIVASWFLSPIASGIVSLVLYLFIRFTILEKQDSLTPGLIALPFFYSFTVFINAFSIIFKGPGAFSTWGWLEALGLSSALACIVFFAILYWGVPFYREKAVSKLNQQNETKQPIPCDVEMKQIESVNDNNNSEEKEGSRRNSEHAVMKNSSEFVDEGDDKPDVAVLFTFLQILTACFGSFAHGANDVSNAIGPLVAVILLFTKGTASGETPLWILLFGGISISIGLWIWGRKVIKTMGNDLTKITPSTGFTIEIGAALTVLASSKIGLPVSTTHCKVGSVVAVGRVHKSRQGVNWKLFLNISIAWVATVPVTALFSGGAMFLLEYFCK